MNGWPAHAAAGLRAFRSQLVKPCLTFDSVTKAAGVSLRFLAMSPALISRLLQPVIESKMPELYEITATRAMA